MHRQGEFECARPFFFAGSACPSRFGLRPIPVEAESLPACQVIGELGIMVLPDGETEGVLARKGDLPFLEIDILLVKKEF